MLGYIVIFIKYRDLIATFKSLVYYHFGQLTLAGDTSERMEQPQSPGTKSVEIREAMEPLLRFTLRSHLDETVPSLDLELPRDLCIHLLEEEDTDSTGKAFRLCFFYLRILETNKSLGLAEFSWKCSVFTEKPAMYKILARALSECLTSEEKGLSVDKGSNFEKYSKLFHGLGHDLVNVCTNGKKKTGS